MNTIFIVTYHKRTSIITPLERRHRLTSIISVRSAYVIELNYVENICTPYIMTESSLFFLSSMRNHKSDLAHSTYFFFVRLVWSRLSLESIKTNLRTFIVLGLGFSIRWFTKSRKRKTIHLAGSISTSPFAFCSLVEFYKLSISLFVVISNYQQ